ncbi:MAG: signal peptidase I [Chloroflexota bacterium]
MRAFLRELLITAALAFIIFLVVNTTLQTSVVIGASMEPNFFEGERLLVNKAAYFFEEPQRGDVIIFKPPGRADSDYIKRIIGLPGDTVEIRGQQVYVDGVPLQEPYITHDPRYTMPETKVASDSYFVLGDNRSNSSDSHTGWLVPRENVVGKVWIYIWPPAQWGVSSNHALDEQVNP